MSSSIGKRTTLNKFGTAYQVPSVDRPTVAMAPPIQREFDSILQGDVVAFVNLSRKIGGELTTMGEHFQRLFNGQKEFLQHAATNRKPSDDQQLNALIKPQSMEIEAICAETNRNRQSPLFNHLSAVSEGVPAFGWIVVTTSPTSYIKDMIDAAQFYTNRVLKDFKDRDPIHIDWVKQWLKVLNGLHSYVKQHHPNGLTWSHQQQSVTKTPSNESRDGVMDSINSLGTTVTSHLKKVPDELKAHKNPQLREQPTIEAPKKIVSNHGNERSAPPKLALEGNKWLVEYQTNRQDLKIDETNMRQTVYIYKCSDCFITVAGKVNSIVLDQCAKVDLHLTSVVSLVEFVNCRKVKAQVTEQVPTVQIEKTDGCHLYLPKSSFHTEFITSKSSEMTINVPVDNGEFKEFPIPEQFKTSLKNGGKQLVTIPNESSGV